ncbi:MAG: thioredoxin-dependent thiol peroxidase [Nanoarchaeota archaeon]
MTLSEGVRAPNFLLKNQHGEDVSKDHFKGKWVVLYFYPKDNTPGCSMEANNFTSKLNKFKKLNAVILGVSPDSCKSHLKFIKDEKLKIILLSDEDKSTLSAYGVWQEKSMYGRKYMGVVRTTFLINPAGMINKIWTDVKVNGHVEAVLKYIKDAN